MNAEEIKLAMDESQAYIDSLQNERAALMVSLREAVRYYESLRAQYEALLAVSEMPDAQRAALLQAINAVGFDASGEVGTPGG